MSTHIASTGGAIEINKKEAIVSGMTYRMICERSSWWLSETVDPLAELAAFLRRFPAFATQEFVREWVKASRRALFLDHTAKNAAYDSILGKMYDIWQATRGSGITMRDIREHLCQMETGSEAIDFFEDAYRRIGIANCVGDLVYLERCMRVVSAPSGGSVGLEEFFAKLCWATENRFNLDDLLDMTPSQVRTISASTEAGAPSLQDDTAAERMVVEKQAKRDLRKYDERYDRMADNFLNGRPMSYVEWKKQKPIPQEPQQHAKTPVPQGPLPVTAGMLAGH